MAFNGTSGSARDKNCVRCSHGPMGRLPCVGDSVELDRPQAGGYTIYEPVLALDDRFQRKVRIEMIGTEPIAIEER